MDQSVSQIIIIHCQSLSQIQQCKVSHEKRHAPEEVKGHPKATNLDNNV